MDKYEASAIIKAEFAIYAGKYPRLVSRLSPYISKHPDSDLAVAEIVRKLAELDQYVEYSFMSALNEIK